MHVLNVSNWYFELKLSMNYSFIFSLLWPNIVFFHAISCFYFNSVFITVLLLVVSYTSKKTIQNETQDILLPANNSTLKQTNNTRALRGWYWCSIANATNGQHNRADSIINCCNCTFCGAFVPFFSLPSSLSLSMDSIFCAFALEGIIKKKGEQGKKDARLRMRVFVCEPARTH